MSYNIGLHDMQNNKIIRLATGSNSSDAVRKDQVATRGGWIPFDPLATLSYSSATVMNTSSDLRPYVSRGTKLMLTNTTTKYFYVVAISSTTITVTGGSDYTLANAAITGYFSHAESPISFPQLFNYSPTFTGFSADPTGTVAQFSIHGYDVIVYIRQPNNGTSNATSFTISAPVQAKTLTNAVWGTSGPFVDNSAASATPGRFQISSGTSTINLFTSMTSAVWTASNGKRCVWMTLTYPMQ